MRILGINNTKKKEVNRFNNKQISIKILINNKNQH
jgi:hypothetical protein